MIDFLRKLNFRLLVLVFLIVIAVLFATHGRICGVESSKEEGNPSDHPTYKVVCEGPLGIGPEGWTAIFTGGLFAFTITLAVATVQLLRVTKNGIDDQSLSTRKIVSANKKSTRRELRAYLFVETVAYYWPDDDLDKPMCARLSFKNYGKTPAYQVEVDIIFMFEAIEKQFMNIVDEKTMRFGMHATQHAIPPDGMFGVDNTTIDQDQIAKLELQKLAYFCFGRVSYLDAFDEPHWVQFQYFHGPEAGNDFHQCLAGNSTDWQAHGEEE